VTLHQTESCYTASVFFVFCMVLLYLYIAQKKRRSRKQTKPGKSGRNFGECILFVIVVIH